jgi:hypothetical protein
MAKGPTRAVKPRRTATPSRPAKPTPPRPAAPADTAAPAATAAPTEASRPIKASRPTSTSSPIDTTGSAETAGATRPAALRVAAAAQAAEAVGLCVAAVFAAVNTADGRSYEQASGIALTLIAFGTAVLLAFLARGLAQARPWSRTPAVMTQLFVGIAGILLVDGHRIDWAVPTLAVAAICLAGIFAPASLRALNRPPRPQSPAP